MKYLATLALSLSLSAQICSAKIVKTIINRPHVILTCDPELDDNNSLIRFLLYSTDYNIDGLIYASSQFHWKGDGKGTTHWVPGREYGRAGITTPMTSWRWAKDEHFIHDDVEAYAKVYNNLKVHNPNYPTPEHLRSVIRFGNIEFDGDFSKDTPGSELIKNAILGNDSSKLYILIWGGGSTVARALKSIQDIYSEQDGWQAMKKRIAQKVILCLSGDQDDTEARYMKPFWGEIPRLTLNESNIYLVNYLFAPGTPEEDKIFTTPEWGKENVLNRGPLGAQYRSWGDGKQMVQGDIFDYFGIPDKSADELRKEGYFVWTPTIRPKGSLLGEGDTFTFLNLIDNGLRAYEDDSFGGWGGVRRNISQSKDSDKAYGNFTGTPVQSSLPKILPDFTEPVENGLAARLKWSVTARYADANHEPVIKGPSTISAIPGSKVTINCNVSDPDKDKITLYWADFATGTYPQRVKIEQPNNAKITFTLPSDMKKGETIHLVLTAKDDGRPALTTYQRVIIKAE